MKRLIFSFALFLGFTPVGSAVAASLTQIFDGIDEPGFNNSVGIEHLGVDAQGTLRALTRHLSGPASVLRVHAISPEGSLE